jgi:hypothetical protein
LPPLPLRKISIYRFLETVAAMQSFFRVDEGNLSMYAGRESLRWRTSPWLHPVNT